MRSSSILLAAGLTATTTTALVADPMPINVRAVEAAVAAAPAHVGRRDLSSCSSVATAVLPKITDGIPTPPADVASYLAFSATVTDPCVDPTITGSIGSAFSTFASEYTSWRQAHITDFRSLWQACSDVPGVASVLPTGTDQCSSLVAEITSAGSNGGQNGGNGNGGGSGNAAAPRETGAVMAAAAVAGFVVAAMQ